ncbi:hypothetical protein BJF79_26305 [Actinomadura sp. CNU-125]|uniref:hypothetical protein n=1 Tax=Actinomadura sp. CNU-125 TaxID=1904961 RepID=UPI0009635CEA|nr:hypothetical protein [Actinomadura sp. CNU-125]OLT10339.1 hypothetical protein BJF79_26305 [Actinomadura sp. CNU-125]
MNARGTDAALEIVEALLAIVQAGPQDLTWQHRYASEDELVCDLRDHAARLRRGDASRLPDLRHLLLPTAPLCEIAISSGWSETYLTLANRLDEAAS